MDVAAAAAPQRRPRLCCPSPPSVPCPRAQLTLVAFFAAYSPQQLLFYLFYLTFLLCECATVCVPVCVQVCVSAGDHCAAVAAVAVAVAGENPKVPRDSAKC